MIFFETQSAQSSDTEFTEAAGLARPDVAVEITALRAKATGNSLTSMGRALCPLCHLAWAKFLVVNEDSELQQYKNSTATAHMGVRLGAG